MRKTVRLLFICILTISLLLMPGFAQTGGNGGAVGGKTQKAIAIVLDDSTSMVRDGWGQRESDYTTRWVEADYSVRALAAMMEIDRIRRLIMGSRFQNALVSRFTSLPDMVTES